MTLKKKDFQKLVNFVKEFQGKLPCNESSAELRDSLNMSLLLMHKYYKKARVRCHANGTNTLDGSLNLSTSLTGAASPLSPYISQVDRFDWRWLSLDVAKLSASFGHGDKANFVPEIFFVIKDCDFDQLKKMVNEDVDKVNELDAIGRTTAMYATNGGASEYLDCLKFLITKGVDLQHQSTDGFTCLHIACFCGYKEFVLTLLDAKVEVNSQDSEGRSPLHFAAAYCSQDILQMLLANGANPSVHDNEGLTPAMWACHFDQLENLQVLLAIEEESNPSPEMRFEVVDNLGRTILHWAVTKANNVDCMRFLLNAETAQLCDDEGKTIFLMAAEHGCLPACEEVLDLCSEDVLEDLDNFGRGALHLAAIGGHGEVVDFLLSKGALTDRRDCQGVTPIDIVTSRKLNYCNLVFTSYQRYRDRLANMQATLGGDEKRVENGKLQESEKNIGGHIDVHDEDYGIEKVVEPIEERNSNGNDNNSLKIDCQGAVGFEIEGDIEEDGEFDVLEEDKVKANEEKGDSVVIKKDVDHPHGDMSESNSRKESENNKSTAKEMDQTGKVEKGEKLKNINDAMINNDITDGAVVVGTDVKHDKLEEETENTAKKIVEESGVEVKEELPPEELKPDEESEDSDYDFEDVSIGGGEQKIVLVAHHEGGEKFEIDFGNSIDDLEFQDDEEDDEGGLADNKLVIGESDMQNSSEFNDAMKVGVDRDLSPKVESVTRLMETNTLAANQSVSMNMDVSSLRSDSEDEDAMPSGREKISKLDSKIPVFDNHSVNQLEYRDPFAKMKSLRNLDESGSSSKRNEDSRPKTSHGKRKEKKDSQKNRQLSPKSKQSEGHSSPRSHLGALEPMKPLQPIIPSQGIQGPRSIGGSQGNFPGTSIDSLKPSLPRSPKERSNGLPSPVDSPRSKGGHLSSPRGGLDGKDNKLSHIPRPNSPSSRERQLPMANNNIFGPRPPFGR